MDATAATATLSRPPGPRLLCHVELDCALASVRAGREALAGSLEQADERRDDLALVASELLTNAVVHSGAPGGRVSADLTLDGDRLRLEVGDPGPGFTPRRRRPSSRRPDGRGLAIVEHLSGAWGVRRRPSVVWCELGGGIRSPA